MLVLTRKVGEAIRIGDEIRIVVHRLSDKRVRLGIQAPKEVPVHREEVSNRIQECVPATEEQTSIKPVDSAISTAN